MKFERSLRSALALLPDRRGNSSVEFAFVAPVFLCFVFLILDGGRALFTRQALGELATATARCAALKSTGCTTGPQVLSWAKARGQSNSQLATSAMTMDYNASTTCNGASGMAKIVLYLPYASSGMNLLPQSVVPATFTATSCFPVPA